MLYRRFKTPTGQFIEGLASTEADEFRVPGETQAEQIATRLGLPTVLFVDDDADPWDGTSALLPLPAPTAIPLPPFATMTAAEATATTAPGPLATAVAILAKADADITPGEVKALVLLMARFLLKKILGGWR